MSAQSAPASLLPPGCATCHDGFSPRVHSTAKRQRFCTRYRITFFRDRFRTLPSLTTHSSLTHTTNSRDRTLRHELRSCTPPIFAFCTTIASCMYHTACSSRQIQTQKKLILKKHANEETRQRAKGNRNNYSRKSSFARPTR